LYLTHASTRAGGAPPGHDGQINPRGRVPSAPVQRMVHYPDGPEMCIDLDQPRIGTRPGDVSARAAPPARPP
jgi:hypothetical protein